MMEKSEWKNPLKELVRNSVKAHFKVINYQIQERMEKEYLEKLEERKYGKK